MAAALAPIPALYTARIVDTTFSSLRNGDPDDVVPATRPSSIPDCYHWITINVTALGAAAVPPNERGRYTIGAAIRAYYARIAIALVPAAGAIGDAAHVAAIQADASIRQRAILIAAARAGAMDAWELGLADIDPAQCAADAHIVLDGAGGVAAAGPVGPGVNPWAVLPRAAVFCDPLGDAPFAAIAASFAPLTDAELEVIPTVILMGAASVVHAGFSLEYFAHHYLSSQGSRVAATLTQLYMGQSPAAKAWFTAAEAILKDIVFHKGPHVVLPRVLMAQAASPEVARRLRGSNLGAAAVGLPTVEGLMKTGQGYLAILLAVQSLATSVGHRVELPELAYAVREVLLLPRAGALNAAAVPEGFRRYVPVGGTRRALVDRLFPGLIEAARPAVAWCFGYFRGICEVQGIKDDTPAGTLLRSWAGAHAASAQVADNIQGYTDYTMAHRAERNKAQDGILTFRRYTDDPAAAARGAAPAAAPVPLLAPVGAAAAAVGPAPRP